MNYVYFIKAGHKHDKDRVFLESTDRRKGPDGRIFHNNETTNYIRIPCPFFKEHFKYEHLSGIYRTDLTYGDIRQYIETVTEGQ